MQISMPKRIDIFPGRKVWVQISFVLCLGMLFSCSSNVKDDKAVAKVGSKYLYFSEMNYIFPKGCSKADSLSLAKLFIEKWISTQLLLKKAELNLSDEQLNISKEIETYRTSLLIYKYEDQYLQEKLDTLVSDMEIQKYYDANAANFVSDEYAVKAHYLKVPENAPKIYNVKRWYLSDKEKDIQDLVQYCSDNAVMYEDFGNEWVSWTKIQNNLPRQEEATRQMMNSDRIEQQDGGFVYLVRLIEKKAPGDTAPLVFVRDKVKNIIINKRKLNFISELETKIYNDGLAKKQFEIYKID